MWIRKFSFFLALTLTSITAIGEERIVYKINNEEDAQKVPVGAVMTSRMRQNPDKMGELVGKYCELETLVVWEAPVAGSFHFVCERA